MAIYAFDLNQFGTSSLAPRIDIYTKKEISGKIKKFASLSNHSSQFEIHSFENEFKAKLMELIELSGDTLEACNSKTLSNNFELKF